MSWYKEQLLNPNRQKKRLEILSRDKFQCVICADDTQQLHVDHRIYISGKKPWEYENNHLQTLCAKCHWEKSRKKATFIKTKDGAYRSPNPITPKRPGSHNVTQ